jgi:putative chitinase
MKMSKARQEGMQSILTECEHQGVTDKRQIAYILATVYHETGKTMQPVEEVGKGHNRTYGHRVWYNGKPYFDVPFIYYGRGFTQSTWRDIYRALTAAAKREGKDWDFEYNPDLLLVPAPSAWATVYALKAGIYTGRKLSQYFNDTITDPINARRTMNGTRPGDKYPDQAELIATYCQKFYQPI